jgi:hypothetical protein
MEARSYGQSNQWNRVVNLAEFPGRFRMLLEVYFRYGKYSKAGMAMPGSLWSGFGGGSRAQLKIQSAFSI